MGKGLNTFLIKTIHGKGLEEKLHLENLSGTTIAVDFSNMLYKFLDRYDKSFFLRTCDSDYYILEFINLIHKFSKWNIKLIFVFDGKASSLKDETINNRKNKRMKNDKKLDSLLLDVLKSKKQNLDESFDSGIDEEDKEGQTDQSLDTEISLLIRKTKYIKHEHVEKCKELFTSMGVHYIHIISQEADSIFRYLIDKDIAYACYSEDMDMLAYGCKRVLWGLDFNEKNNTINQYNLLDILTELSINYMQFLNAFILSGTSYNKNLKYSDKFEVNLGFIRRFGMEVGIAGVLNNLHIINSGKESKLIEPPDVFPYEKVIDIYSRELSSSIKCKIDELVLDYQSLIREWLNKKSSSFLKLQEGKTIIINNIKKITDNHSETHYSSKIVNFYMNMR